jgi:cytochrome c oxidase subunit II
MQNYGWGLPIDISTHGWQVDRLIHIFHVFMFILFFGWFVFFLYTVIRFRHREGHKAEYHTSHFKLPTYLEVGIAVFELALLLAFSIPAWATVREKFPDAADSVRIRVVAEQFAWNIHYTGKDGVFGKTDPKLMNASNPLGLDRSDPHAKDDVATINQLHIPVDTPVIAELTSKDVIHSFFLPVMRVKQDTVPGQAIPVWFQATQTGQFEIACAQLCGLGHYRMRGFFVVDSKEEFAKWLAGLAPAEETAPEQTSAEQAPAAPALVAPTPAQPAH